MHAAHRRLLLDGEPTGLLAVPCEGFLSRTLGCWRWGGRVPLGRVLWLSPCRAVHTLGLPRAIEVAFCDRRGTILRLVAPVVPQRLAWCAAASGAFELRTGTSLRLGLRVGQRLELERCVAQPVTAPHGAGATHG